MHLHSLFQEITDAHRGIRRDAPVAKDPLTYQHTPGGGIGPWFWCGEARLTGRVIAWPCYGVTMLYWSEDRGVWAHTVEGTPKEGQAVDIGGFVWTVRWTDEARAELERQAAFRTPAEAA